MSYEKQDWTTGDVITAEKLNHMEDGISDALTEVDASELVDSNSLIKAENNKLDVKYDELKSDIATDITAGSNYIDDVNGKIDVDYNSIKAALDADLLTDNDSTLSTMCGSSLQITDSKLEVNIEFLAGDGLMASQTNKFEVDMNTLPSALAGDHLDVDENGKLDVDITSLSIPSIYSQQGEYGDYITITDSNTMFEGYAPTIDYMEAYVTEQGGGKGNMYFSFDENGGGETPTPMLQYYPSGEEYPSYISCVPIIRKDINIGEDIPVLCYQETNGQLGILTNVVYHDSDGFYTVDGNGNRQSITV